MNDFSDELFPDFFGELEPIDFSTTSLLPKKADDHTYVAGSPSSDDSGLSSDASPSTPPTNSEFYFKDSIGGAVDTDTIYIKQEPQSPGEFYSSDFLNDFHNDEWRGVKEEVNLDELPALSALNNPSSILEDEVATEFLTTHELSPNRQNIQKLPLATINMAQIQQIPKRGDVLHEVEFVTTTSNKTNRVNVVRLNKPTSLPFATRDVITSGMTSKLPSVRATTTWSSHGSNHGQIVSGKYPKLLLTSEEKCLLEKEGLSLPNEGPLTKEEDRVLKAVRRKIRNKISAKESRKKKQVYVDGLEDRVKACTVHNIQLQKKIKKLEEQNDSLMQQLKKLQNYVANGASRTTQVSTCAMVLLFSFALVVLPSLSKFVKMEDGNGLALQQEESQKAPIIPGRSRSLLHDMDTDVYTIPYGPQDPLPKSPVPEDLLIRSRSKFAPRLSDDDVDPYGTGRAIKMAVKHRKPEMNPINPDKLFSDERFIRENETSQVVKLMKIERQSPEFDMDWSISTADLKNEPLSNTA